MAKKVRAAGALVIESRSGAGTTGARASRREGKIPGVLYGHGKSTAIEIDAKAFADLLHGASRGKVIDATVDGKNDSVFLRAIERDPIYHRPISADFQRIAKGEEINATIAVHTTGTAPGVRDLNGVLELIGYTIERQRPRGQDPRRRDARRERPGGPRPPHRGRREVARRIRAPDATRHGPRLGRRVADGRSGRGR